MLAPLIPDFDMHKPHHETRLVRVTDVQVTACGVNIIHIDGEPLSQPVRSLFDLSRVYYKALQTTELKPLLGSAERTSRGITADREAKLPPGICFYMQTQKRLYICLLRI